MIDFDKERKRLDAEITKLNGEQQGLRKRLENPDFVSRAAPDVVSLLVRASDTARFWMLASAVRRPRFPIRGRR